MADTNYSSKYSGEQVDAAVEYYLNHSSREENSYDYSNTIFCNTNSDTAPSQPFDDSALPVELPSFPFAGQDGNTWYDVPNSSTGHWYQCVIRINSESKKVISQGSVLDMKGNPGDNGNNGENGNNGNDGNDGDDGKNGNYTEYRFKRASSYALTLTDTQKTSRYPSGWVLDWNLADVDTYETIESKVATMFDTFLCQYASSGTAVVASNASAYFTALSTTPTYTEIADQFTYLHYQTPYLTTNEESQATIIELYKKCRTLYDNCVAGTNSRLTCDTTYHKLYTDYIDEDHFWVLFQIYTVIDGDTDSIVNNWSEPQRIEGVDGKPGPSGSNGISGTPGVSMAVAFTLGTEEEYRSDAADPTVSPYNTNYSALFASGTRWFKAAPAVTTTYPYIWFTQCRYIKTTVNGVDTYTFEDTWSTPQRYTGINGITTHETVYTRNPIIYPAGIFALNTTYSNDGYKTPYVYYDGNYYYLSGQGSWTSDRDTSNPSTASAYWTLMEHFSALFAEVGIIANGLIGSAVFNGDYMFSQRGEDHDGDTVEDSSHYEKFLTDYSTGDTLTDPYDDNAAFKPYICINFRTGEFWSNSVNTALTNTEEGISLRIKNSQQETEEKFQEAGIDITSGKVKVTGEFEGTSSGTFNGDVKASGFAVLDEDGQEVLKFTTYNQEAMGSPSDGSTIEDGTPIMIVNYKGVQYVASMVKLATGSGTTLNYIENDMTTSYKYLTTTVAKNMSTQGNKYECITKAPYLTVRNGSTDTGSTITAILRDANGNEVSWSTVYNKYYYGTCPVVKDTTNTDVSNGVLAYKINGSFANIGSCYLGTPTSKIVAIYKSGYYFGRTVKAYRKANLSSGSLSTLSTYVLVGYVYTIKKTTSSSADIM